MRLRTVHPVTRHARQECTEFVRNAVCRAITIFQGLRRSFCTRFSTENVQNRRQVLPQAPYRSPSSTLSGCVRRSELRMSKPVHEGADTPIMDAFTLVRTRESRGMSRAEVARATRLSPRVLEAIEEGRLQDLPAG